MKQDNEDLGSSIAVPVLFETEDVLVINKPAGLIVHHDGRTHEYTLLDWLRVRYPSIEHVGGLHTLDTGRYVSRMGVLHRLDRDTSGVILIAKHDEIFYFLQRQFLDRSIQKIYHAFVCGVPKPPEGIIELPIGRSRIDFRKWTTGENARGTLREAITHYKTLKTNNTKSFSFVELSPKTGRTHQLRVHLSAIGNPIIGDVRYETPPALGIDRLALHASRLTFMMRDNKKITIVAELPKEFQIALDHFE